MPKTEDGEYELVLGNSQLLSIFFIVVVLLGIGFTLGYLLGRNGPGNGNTELAETSDSTATPVASNLPPPPTTTQAEEPAYVPPPKPAATVTRPSASEMPSAPPDTQDPAPAATAASKDSFRTGNPPKGSVFIQVSAVKKADAEMEANTLSKRGFPTWVMASPANPELFSVLIGPYAEKADLAKAKASLEQLGFRKAFRREIK